jgi:membrane-bound lytic murein transglycosylase D
MKTMLKRKQKKTGFVSYGFLLLSTPAITAISQDPSNSLNAKINYRNQTETVWFADTTVNKSNVVDSSTLFVSNEAVEKKSAKAPTVRLNSNATKFVKDYVSKNAECLGKIKERSDSYFTVMDKVFGSYNLPVQLKYLAVVESELKLKAVSHVGAVGLWQLMPGTAKMLGLKVTSKYDERRLCYKSTKAAAKYLNDLYREFGDWLLVIAAYNSGPGPVYTAIKKSGSHNFWRLQQYLPLETRLHVKRFISTHYYFEGEGSITTLTKAEAAEHLKALTKFKESSANELREVASVSVVENNQVEPVILVQ